MANRKCLSTVYGWYHFTVRYTCGKLKSYVTLLLEILKIDFNHCYVSGKSAVISRNSLPKCNVFFKNERTKKSRKELNFSIIKSMFSANGFGN